MDINLRNRERKMYFTIINNYSFVMYKVYHVYFDILNAKLTYYRKDILLSYLLHSEYPPQTAIQILNQKFQRLLKQI